MAMEVWLPIWDAFNARLFSLGEGSAVTPLGLIVLVLILVMTWIVAGRVRWLFERRLASVAGMQTGTRHAIGTLVRYSVIFLGFFIGLRSVGFQLDAILVALGALGIGIGFGLQNIANNFISGIILLTEQPIKVGDVIDVGGAVLGTVERVGIRATTVRQFDQTQAIVPNADLISSVVTNWTLDDRRVRIDFIVGVAYGSDTALVRRLLEEDLARHPDVLEDPEPRVLFTEFGDSSLNFRILAYVADLTQRLTTQSDLHFAIDTAFRDHNIEIPFPQRDLHLRSIDDGVRVRHLTADARG
jgi:small-conductance mechanosensitive channel